MMKEYKTFAEQFCLEDASFLKRWGRNYRLLLWMLQNILTWYRARHMRAEFQRTRQSKETFYVDPFAGPSRKP